MSSHRKGTNANRNRNTNRNRSRNSDGDSTREQLEKGQLEKELAELRVKLSLSEKQTEKEKKRADENEKQKEEEKKRAEEERQLRVGTFYATFDEVWRPEGAPYSFDDYMNMMRSGPPQFADGTPGNDYFALTLSHAINKDAVASDSSQKSRNSHSNATTNERTWPVDVFQSEFENRNDAHNFLLPSGDYNGNRNQVQQRAQQVTRDATAQLAHLVPASSDYSSLYHHIARWVFGLGNGRLEPTFVQKLIHGSEENGTRASGTGLKHMACNKIFLSDQWEYYDKKPCLVIVPVLTLEQAIGWGGQGYHAIAMMSSGSKDIKKGQSLKTVAGSLHFQDKGEVATEEEIGIARNVLEKATKGMAFATLHKSEPTDDWVKALKPSAQNMLKKVQDELTAVDASAQIIIPATNGQGNQKPVRKITFGPASQTTPNSHPAPDPLLLVVKAALNWSMFHEQKLMAAGERDESDAATSNSSLEEMEDSIAEWEHRNADLELAETDNELLNAILTIVH